MGAKKKVYSCCHYKGEALSGVEKGTWVDGFSFPQGWVTLASSSARRTCLSVASLLALSPSRLNSRHCSVIVREAPWH